MRIFITGACGLVGSQCVDYFAHKGWKLTGIDNNQRMDFFGPTGSILAVKKQLLDSHRDLALFDLDIRDFRGISELIAGCKPNLIVHCAAQPSHDLAATRVFDDFGVNAQGTLNLLEATRLHSPEAVFAFLSTNKVYGDGPNQIELVEASSRWEFAEAKFAAGIPETFSIDQSLHSLFGVSKAAADLLVQEYGRYFHMPTVCLRAGCITGRRHQGVELHGFLSHLVRKTSREGSYTVFGYKGKQVRDQIHAWDVATAIEAFYHAPKSAAVYNLGGGKDNSISVNEALALVGDRLNKKITVTYVEEARQGDHICYYSDLRKFKSDYPAWQLRYDIPAIFSDLLSADQ